MIARRNLRKWVVRVCTWLGCCVVLAVGAELGNPLLGLVLGEFAPVEFGLGEVAYAHPPGPPPEPVTLTIHLIGGAAVIWRTDVDPDVRYEQFPAQITVDPGTNVGLQAENSGLWHFFRWEYLEGSELQVVEDSQLSITVNENRSVTAVYLMVDMEVSDGCGTGLQPVPEDLEESRGAYSVANMNDTDGDGAQDGGDPYVPGETDLIKVVLKRPEPQAKVNELGGYACVNVTAGLLWQSSSKGGTGTTVMSFPVSEMPSTVTVWWEFGWYGAGNIGYSYNSASDSAKGTFFNINLWGPDLGGTLLGQLSCQSLAQAALAYIHFNVDNDNLNETMFGNPIADKDEDGFVLAEDDLACFYATVSPRPWEGIIALKRAAGGPRVWKHHWKGAENAFVTTESEKTWDMSVPGQWDEFNALGASGNLFAEGYEEGIWYLTLELRIDWCVFCDNLKYGCIAAVCGDQPNCEQRALFADLFSQIIHCEWSITAPASSDYNCIAWSVDEDDEWYSRSRVDAEFDPSPDGFTNTDMWWFYWTKKQWIHTTATGTSFDLLMAREAEAMYYLWNQFTDVGYHGARNAVKGPLGCDCGQGKWIMYESKCGGAERIAHVWYQLNGDDGAQYGSPGEFYSPNGFMPP